MAAGWTFEQFVGGDQAPPPYFPGGNVTNNAKTLDQYGNLANPDAPNVDPNPGPAYGHEATGPAPAEAAPDNPKGWSFEEFAAPSPAQKPQAPGFTPAEQTEMASRKPTDSAWPLGNPFTDQTTQLDPVAAVAQLGAGAAKFFGMDETNAAKLGRDIHALPNSMGPLGYEFAPLDSAPRPASAEAPSQAELFQAGKENRTEALATPNEMLPPEVAQSHIDALKAKLNEKFLSVDPDLHGTAAKVMPKVLAAAERPQSIEDLARLRAKVDTVVENGVKPNGHPNQEGAIGTMMRNAVNDMIEAHPQGAQFRQADSQFNRAYKDQIISDAMNKARAGLDETANNRAAMREVYNKYYKRNTFSKEELKAIRQAGGPGYLNPLRILAGAGIGNSLVGPALGATIAHFFGLPPEAVIVAGTLAKGVQKARSDAGLMKIGELIRNGGPTEQARLKKLGDLFSPKVLLHVAKDGEGAKRVQAWISSPSALTARALASYTSQKVKDPKVAGRIMRELLGNP